MEQWKPVILVLTGFVIGDLVVSFILKKKGRYERIPRGTIFRCIAIVVAWLLYYLSTVN